MGEISIRQFLTREESRDLVNQLEKIGIKAWTHPMTSGEGDLDINQVFIDELDVVKSKETLDIFNKIVKSKTLIDKFSCPKCKAKLPHIVYNWPLNVGLRHQRHNFWRTKTGDKMTSSLGWSV